VLLDALRRGGVPFVGADVLEVGCGGGYYLHRFLEFGARSASGIDLMEDRAREAVARYPQLDVRAGDASRLEWDDASFDLVTQVTCLSSVLDPGLRRRICGEMWRVLRPGGAIVSIDLAPQPRLMRMLGRLARRLAGGDRATAAAITPTRGVGLGELRSAFAEGTDLRHRGFGPPPDYAAVAGRAHAAAAALSVLPPMHSHLLVVVRKPGGEATAR
jgi:SAM-dependent methyltransferase